MADSDADLYIEQGATYRRSMLWRQPKTPEQEEAGAPGTPYDLTDCRAHMQIRKKVNAAEVLCELFDGDGITLGGEDGTIAIEISPERTMELELKRAGAYDLYVIFPSGVILRVIQGKVNVSLTVTDPVDA